LLLALVPVLSLFGLFVFTTSVSARHAINLARVTTVRNITGQPTAQFLGAIDAERPLAIVYLADPTPANRAALSLQAQKTNRAVDAMRAAVTSSATMNSATAAETQAIGSLLHAFGSLTALRGQITSLSVSRTAALAAYDGIVNDAYIMLEQAIRQETDATIVSQALAFVRMGRSEDMLLQEDALLVGDLTVRAFPAADRQAFTEFAGARRALFSLTLPDLDPVYRVYYTRYITPQALGALTGLENKVIRDTRPGQPPAIQPLAWQQAVLGVSAGLTRASNAAANVLAQQASTDAWSTNRGLIVTGGIGLLLVLLSIIVAIFTSRSLVRELTGLRQSALDLANNRLPEVVDRLALGQPVDVSAEAPEIPASSDEIGQVRDAFAAVQRTAVQAAVGQARLRQGMSDVFRNLARRSQSLLHRQLTLLDAMERRARDPQELEDLFRIDHLTTRMRRHAESLIILSGHAPARGWRNPVPLVDVLRAAVAEVEDYTRIRVTSATQAALAGPAVGDVIHMIAELAENATMFSPPSTPVTIHGDIVGQGVAVEIEDRGLGLSDDQLTSINEMLANPPPFDPSGSDQLGLFVAGRLAKRQNIKISVRTSPYGGTTAIVLIPRNLVVTEEDQARNPALTPRPGRGPRVKARPAIPGFDAPADEATGPLVLAPSTIPGPRPGIDVPAMREPADASGLGPPGPDLAGAAAGGLGGSGFGLADRGTAGLGADDPGPVRPGPGGLSTGTFGGTDVFSPGGAGAGDPDTMGLPRRVRQASLAPQLRESTIDPVPAPGAGDSARPTPEEARSTMTAIQHGWERGRSIFDLPDTAGPGAENGEPSPADDGLAGYGATPSDAGTPDGTGTTPAIQITPAIQTTPDPETMPGTEPAGGTPAPGVETGTEGTQIGEASSDGGGSGG
jgi:signal transduction histidine kinase